MIELIYNQGGGGLFGGSDEQTELLLKRGEDRQRAGKSGWLANAGCAGVADCAMTIAL